jgi:hypothetical protein
LLEPLTPTDFDYIFDASTDNATGLWSVLKIIYSLPLSSYPCIHPSTLYILNIWYNSMSHSLHHFSKSSLWMVEYCTNCIITWFQHDC